MAIGRLLFAANKNDILELKRTSFTKVNIRLKTGEAANKILSSPILRNKKYKVYIPSHRIVRKGIICGVPLDSTEEEILKGLKSKASIISAQRLSRKRKEISDSIHSNISGSFVPSQSILITFKGQFLPEYLYLYMMKHNISPFVSKTSLCYTCFCLGT